jgi:uncharacterized protein YccT (UPF0319 family)
MGSVKQHQIALGDLNYSINQLTKELARLRKYGGRAATERIADLMAQRRTLRSQRAKALATLVPGIVVAADMLPLATSEAFRCGSPYFGWMVSPTAKVVQS